MRANDGDEQQALGNEPSNGNPNDQAKPQSDSDTSDAQAPAAASPPAEASAPPRQRRGFATMDRRLVTEIARKGGQAAHAAGTAHEFTPEEARTAGRRGGLATHANRRQARQKAPEHSALPKG